MMATSKENYDEWLKGTIERSGESTIVYYLFVVDCDTFSVIMTYYQTGRPNRSLPTLTRERDKCEARGIPKGMLAA
jgi:phosphoribosyl-AMP cyclohydrolase